MCFELHSHYTCNRVLVAGMLVHLEVGLSTLKINTATWATFRVDRAIQELVTMTLV